MFEERAYVSLNSRETIMDAGEVAAVLDELVAEISNGVGDARDLAAIGIHTRGIPLARRIVDRIAESTGAQIELGSVGITLYRDDLGTRFPKPVVQDTSIDFDVADKRILLVDDVLFTGRTVRAALDEIVDFGRPARIELAVLIDRGHRELPIQPDYVGRRIATSLAEMVKLRLQEVDGEDKVELIKAAEGVSR
jgi:pyrimidine operon attenuation protein/uracil phosphoribosyltransferase